MAFIIEKNKFTTIIGPSGCGKSTLLKAIVGLDQDYEGLIKLNGRGINSPTKRMRHNLSGAEIDALDVG